jgi:thiamine kinase-like enzyme
MKKLGSAQNADEELAEQALLAMADVDLAAVTYRTALPGVASPSYHAVESLTFDVALDGKGPSSFLKVGIAEVADLVNGNVAFQAASRLHGLGFSPKPLHQSTEQRVFLSERLDENWRAAKIDELMPYDRVAQLIAMQKSIAGGTSFGRPWSVFDGIELLWETLSDSAVKLPADAAWTHAAMTPIRDALAASGVDLRPAHGDPHSSNVMIGPGKALMLVDFDMAADLDPYYQLGIQMNELYQFESQMMPLLEMHDGHVSGKAFNRCRLYAAADDFYWALRSMLLEARSPRSSVEFLKYAEWRFLRCRMLVGRPGFEELIRSI